MKRVVITGLGLQTPVGNDPETFRKAVLEGTPNFKLLPNPIIDDKSKLIVGECSAPDSGRLMDRKVQKVTTRKDILGLIAAFDSIRDAGLEKGDIDPERIGIFTGAASTHLDDLLPYRELLETSTVEDRVDSALMGRNLLGNVNPMVMMQSLMNNVLCYTSIPFDIRGVNANFMDYQVAGLRALGEAYWAIKESRADYVVAGGVCGAVDFYHAAEGIELGYLAPAVGGESPSCDVVRPFDRQRSGTVLSEAGAFCVLESLDIARRRGAKIYAEVLGFSGNTEASFHYMGQNNGQAMQRCLKEHIASQKITKVGAVYAHANGSVKADDIDLRVLESVFSGVHSPIPTLSIKGVTGETSEACGVLSVIDAVKSMDDGFIPGTHNFSSANICPQYIEIQDRSLPLSPGAIIVTGQGFSGVNCVVSLQKFVS